MTLNGPHNSPLALGVRPWGCLFFSFWALYVIGYAMQGFLILIDPTFMEAVLLGETEEGLRGTWTVILVSYVATLFLTMVWAEHVGAGPFAASMNSERNWILLGLVGGPLVLNSVTFLVDLAMAGAGANWHLAR